MPDQITTDDSSETTPTQLRTRPLLIGAGIVILLTIVSGAIHGRLTNRWAVANELKTAGDLLQKLPVESVDDWQFEGTLDFDENSIRLLECTGHVSRVYVNPNTGDTIRMFVIVGPRGPISVHTPDVCFSSRAYRMPEPSHLESVVTPDTKKHSFWESDFESREALNPHELIAWHGWSTGGEFSAPKYQRVAYLGSPMLYKIQLSCRVQDDRQTTKKLMAGFVRDFLPQLQKQMK